MTPHAERHWIAAQSFDEGNPHVYDMVVRLAFRALARGRAHYGIGAIFEQLRYLSMRTRTNRYRLNNNYRAYYVRKMMAEHPKLETFFEVRVSMFDEPPSTAQGRLF